VLYIQRSFGGLDADCHVVACQVAETLHQPAPELLAPPTHFGGAGPQFAGDPAVGERHLRLPGPQTLILTVGCGIGGSRRLLVRQFWDLGKAGDTSDLHFDYLDWGRKGEAIAIVMTLCACSLDHNPGGDGGCYFQLFESFPFPR
jgi:hypothetical protein